MFPKRRLLIHSHHATRFQLIRRVMIGLALLACTPTYAATDLNVPYIGEPADRSLSPLQETELGNEVMRQLRQGGYVLEDPELTDYISELGKKLLRHTNEQGIPFQFFIVNDNAINAFALPGGFIGINAGLLTASQTESELAGVMGHEIAHVTQRHIARSMDQGSGWDIASAALVIAALIAGAHDPDIAQAAISIGMSAAIQHQINFTRANELEADRLGIKTLSSAGFDPLGMPAFFHRLSQNAQLYGEGVPELLRTHPMNTNRIAEAQARVASLPKSTYKPRLEYGFMKSRAQVLMTELAADSLSHFSALSASTPTPAHEYGLALALARNRAFKDADAVLNRLLKKMPKQVNLEIERGRLLSQSGKGDAALKVLSATHKLHPDYRPTTITLADILIREGKAAEARQLLLESDLLLQEDAECYRLLALAARDMGQPAEAHFQMAGYEHARGDYVAATRQLHHGLRIDSIGEHDKQRLQGRLAQYLAEAPESERRRARAQPEREYVRGR